MLEDVLDLLTEKLATCAPAGVGNPAKAQDGAPPRYVFVPRDIDHAPTTGSVQPLDGGDYRELMVADAHGVDVYCWGTTMGGCERLRQALLTVCARELADNILANEDKSEWITDTLGTRGIVLIVKLTIKLGLPYALIPAELGDDIIDATDTIVTIEEVGFDPAGATPGDGKLTAGEA